VVVVARERRMHVAERQMGVQLCGLVWVVSAVFVGFPDIDDSNARPRYRRDAATVLGVANISVIPSLGNQLFFTSGTPLPAAQRPGRLLVNRHRLYNNYRGTPHSDSGDLLVS
jgi:hypothetical protein